jgi:hypothetical protein
MYRIQDPVNRLQIAQTRLSAAFPFADNDILLALFFVVFLFNKERSAGEGVHLSEIH